MESEGGMPGPGELSDKDFVQAYQENGFGWGGAPGEEKIRERHARLRESRPDLYPAKASVQIDYEKESNLPGNSDEQDIHHASLSRNLEGQYVDPKTNEPIREGSPEWRDLARRNQLPRNQ